jgi:uncharacterized membrane-anchored protein
LWISVAGALQVLFLLGMALSYYAVGWYGQEIRLKTIPIDPKDYLYGDYVTLNYEVSQLKPELWNKQTDGELPQDGSVVYVLLRSDGGLYKAVQVSGSKPQAKADEAVLKGVVQSRWDDTLQIKYGIERYYIPEGTGKELEEKARDTVVKVKLAPWGQMKLEGLES